VQKVVIFLKKGGFVFLTVRKKRISRYCPDIQA